MNKKFTTYSILLLAALLMGCNDSSTTNNSATPATSGTPEATTSGSDNGNTIFHSLLSKTDLAIKGQLTEMSYQQSNEGIPHTFVTYSVDEVIVGNYDQDSITFKFVGGDFNGDSGNTLIASNAPRVELNEEAILLIQKNDDTGCDLTNCEHGRFLIENNEVIAANESSVLVEDKGQLSFISLSARKSGLHKARRDNMSPQKFIDFLKSIDTKSGGLRKGRASVTSLERHVPFDAAKSLTSASAAPATNTASVASNTSRKQGSAFDQWEEEQLRQNGGNPVLGLQYPGDYQ